MKKNLVLCFLVLVIVPIVLQRGGIIGYGPFYAKVPAARDPDRYRERPSLGRQVQPAQPEPNRERPSFSHQVQPAQPEPKCECPIYDYLPQVEVIREPRYSWDPYCECWMVEVIEYHRFLR